MPEPAFVVEDYSFWFKLPSGERRLALDNLSFSVDKGSFVLILGESGSGKSTLALNLVGIYPDYFGGFNEGRILVNHSTKGLVNRRELDRGERFKTVNMLFQNPEDQIVTLTVEEEIAFALENYLVPPAEIRPRVTRALELVGLQGFKDRSTLKLSGGEKQRVALAAMLAMEPSVLILDEPTSNLDPAGTEEVLEAVRLVRERLDITLVIVEHEVDRVFHMVDEVLLVDGLTVHGPESPRGFLAKRGMQIRDDMGLWIPQASEVSLEIARRGVSLPRTHLTGKELVDDLGAAGARGPAAPPPGSNEAAPRRLTAAEPAIRVRGVGFSYPSKSDVLRDIDLDIDKHELLAIVGQNGSGKSTLASCLTGLFAPTSGSVVVDGKRTGDYKFADLARRVAYIFQVPEKQFVRKSVYEEMAHGLKALKVPADEVEQRVDEVLRAVRLEERKDSSPFLLSHGQKRRLSVACMVISEPEVVILDEPTFGQDWRQAGRLMDYMRSLADAGAAVTFITHDMRLVAEYADRCVAMSEGRIIFNGGPLELFSSPGVLTEAKLKAPPVFDFSRELLGEPTLATIEVIDQLEARFGRPGAVLQGS
ncbi:MAG: ABC transporter ATP-binding protein [Actinomycetota bacterium]